MSLLISYERNLVLSHVCEIVRFFIQEFACARIRIAPAFHNFEEVTKELGGIKMLYSESYYSEEEFSEIYGGKAYQQLKRAYDPGGKFKSLYEKCVRRL